MLKKIRKRRKRSIYSIKM